MDDPYVILGVSPKDSIEVIKKKYKKLALLYHPDRNSQEDRVAAEEKFKRISNAYNTITSNPVADNMFFQNFTERIINKGNFFGDFLKNFDKNKFKTTLFNEMKNYKTFYENINTTEYTEDININVNIEMADIYNNVEKVIDLDIDDKCEECIINDLKICPMCDTTGIVRNKKKIVFMCADKQTIYSSAANYEPNKKRGAINIRICSKPHHEFRILNDYDLLYEIYIADDGDNKISHSIIQLDGTEHLFVANPPYKAEYVICEKGLYIPHRGTRGDLVVKIIKNIYS